MYLYDGMQKEFLTSLAAVCTLRVILNACTVSVFYDLNQWQCHQRAAQSHNTHRLTVHSRVLVHRRSGRQDYIYTFGCFE